MKISEILVENPEKLSGFKEWMAPNGVPHIFDEYDEHNENHHPMDNIKTKGFDSLVNAISKGFTRFGITKHGAVFIHYDRSNPLGKKSAIETLKYLKNLHPRYIYLTKNPSFSPINKEVICYNIGEAMREIKETNDMLA